MNQHEFFTGQEFFAYEYFGAHIYGENVTFRIWAPEVLGVAVMGDFNNWMPEPMIQDGLTGIYEKTLSARAGQYYKYRIYHKDGRAIDHCDPYGFGSELRPGWASRITDMRFDWTDKEFMTNRD